MAGHPRESAADIDAARLRASAAGPTGTGASIVAPTAICDAMAFAPAPSAPVATTPVAPAAPDAQPRASGLAELRRAVFVGLVLAVAIVGLALFLRPAASESAPVFDGAAPVPDAIGSGPTPAPARASATQVAETSVRLRLDPGLPEARRAALAAAARRAGYADIRSEPAPVSVARSRIEYFGPADRAAAEALARALAPMTGGPIETRDLAGVTGSATPGRIEAWLADYVDAR